MNKFKRTLSILLILSLVLPLLPTGLIKTYAYDEENFVVNNVTLYKIYDRNRNMEGRRILIRGKNLKDAPVGIITSQGYKALPRPTVNQETILQFDLKQDELGEIIRIGSAEIKLDEGLMPSLSSVSRKVESENGTLTLKGSNFNRIDGRDIRAYHEQAGNPIDISDGFRSASNTEANIDYISGNLGLQHLIFKKETESPYDFNDRNKQVEVGVSITYTYKDQFNLYQTININDGLEMRPTRGIKGETVFFEAPFNGNTQDLQEYDVFFLKEIDGTDEYSVENKGKNRRFQTKVKKGEGEIEHNVLTVEVPDLPLGEYYVVLTNVVDGKNPMANITQEKILDQKFTVIDGSIKSTILDVQPNRGPDTGSKTTITGQFFGSLNIAEFTPTGDGKLKVITQPSNKNPRTLKVEYGPGTYGDENNNIPISKAERSIKVLIGGEATFLTTEDGKKFDVDFNKDLDKLNVRTGQVTDGETNPIKDVVVETTTTFHKRDGGTIIIRERAELKKGYTYILSKVKPTINSIVPDKIQVSKATSNYQIPEDRLVAIHGENFMVDKYIDDKGVEIVRYPRITIGEVTLDKNIKPDLDIKFLDEKGQELDGTQNNDMGNKILITLPKGTPINNLGKADLVVQNPIRNSTGYGLLERKTDFVEFVAPGEDDNPVITKLNPDTAPVDGGELITIEGANFQQGVKVFIDGEEVKSIKRREDGKQITLTAPRGRVGETQLQVMNPKGGMDTKPFFYVTTFTNPKIIDFNPKRGNTGTVVRVKGENFLKPDPIATAQNPYRLIGTRVLLGGIELNEYNKNPITKRIEVKEFTPKEVLFEKYGESIKVADYHSGLLLKTKEDKYYTVDIKSDGDIILSDGGNNSYTIELNKDKKIVANKLGGDIHQMEISTSGITIKAVGSSEDIKLTYASLYKIEEGKIVGNKVKVIDRDTIYFDVPVLGSTGFYDLTVINPDTKKDSKTGKAGFEYIAQPDLKPKIYKIYPNEGSVEGGYTIDIEGEEFEAGEGNKPRVFIDGVEVPEKDTIVDISGKKITVRVPKYDGDLKEDKGTSRWPVPVVVLNPDGSTASKRDGFYYVLPSSNPKIQKVIPQKGTAAGGDIVEITGFDFRYFEPYDDTNRNQIKDEDEKWNDLYEDGIWNDLLDLDKYTKEEKDEILGKTAIEHPRFTHYYDSPILPKIYFGNKQAKIVEFSRGYIKVISPSGKPGKEDVFLVNNDGGISNKVGFTYEASQVKIDSIIPNQGKRQGGDPIEIHGSGFTSTGIEIYEDGYKNGESEYINKNMPMIKFGNIGNKDIARDKANSGRIDQNRATVNLDGGLKAEFNGVDRKVRLVVEEGDKIYTKEILGYDNSVKYVPVSLLKDKEGNPYKGKELIKLEIKDRRFIVERGYSETTNYLNSTQLTVETPSYYTVGKVPVFVVNPDGGRGKGDFEYKNPDSKPVITNITRNGRNPKEEYREEINGKAEILKVDHKGGSIISVHGSDFRTGANINISNLLRITEEDIAYDLPTKLTFKIPAVAESEVGKIHRLSVTNPDGGSATSDRTIPPIFIEFTKGETNPEIYSIEPEKGSSIGGTKVKIRGNDFRKNMEEYEGEKLRVYFGEMEVDSKDIKFIDYKTIEVIAPKSKKIGQVDVKVENPDGSMSQDDPSFTYISKPTIDKVSPNKIFTNDTETEVTIRGTQFQQGAKVVVGGKIIDKKDIKKGMDIKGEGIIGADSQGRNREVGVLGGMEAAKIKVEGNNVIKLVFEEATDLENSHLIIINPDGGISDPYDRFEYEKPVPTKPLVLEGIPGYESTVQLIWSKSSENILNKASRYEIYGKLAKDKDYTFIGDTENAEFLVKGLEIQTEYEFMVRALNSYGGAIDFAKVKVKTLTLREDEKLKEKEEKRKEEEKEIKQKGKEEIVGDRVVHTIGRDTIKKGLVDFTLAKYKNNDKFTVAVPLEFARKDTNLTIKDGTMTSIINLKDLYTLGVSKKDRGNKDAYVNIHIDRTKESHIPRGRKAASKAYSISFDYKYGKNILEIKDLVRPGKIIFQQDKIAYPGSKGTRLYNFNEGAGQYFPTGSLNTSIKGKGKYMLLSNR